MSRYRTFAAAAAALVVSLASCAGLDSNGGGPTTSPSHAGVPSSVRDQRPVVRIVDGDTIVVSGGAKGTKVRLIGIDTPEKDECLFQAATERMRALVGGTTPGLHLILLGLVMLLAALFMRRGVAGAIDALVQRWHHRHRTGQ